MSLGRLLNRGRDFEEPLQELLFTTIYTADHFERGFASFLKPYGLTPCQFDILETLHDAGGRLPSGSLGDRLVKQAASVGAYIDRLARAGLVRRERGQTDRRNVYVVLEEDGRSKLDQIRRRFTYWEEGLIGHLTDDEAQTATRILKKAAKPSTR